MGWRIRGLTYMCMYTYVRMYVYMYVHVCMYTPSLIALVAWDWFVCRKELIAFLACLGYWAGLSSDDLRIPELCVCVCVCVCVRACVVFPNCFRDVRCWKVAFLVYSLH